MLNHPWHTLDLPEVVRTLESDSATGLSPAVAQTRLGQSGLNELVETGQKSPWRILFEQFTATMVLILLAASLVSFLLKDVIDGIAILLIVLLYAVLGFIQEYRAEKAIAALKRMAVPNVRVLRGGQIEEISARQLVPGDIVLLENGAVIPADGRVIESAGLKVLEAALTGESEGVEKNTAPLEREELPLGDRRNMVYMGTIASYGRGRMLVTATGMSTELGRVATLLQSSHSEQTPLQRRLDSLGKRLAVVAFLVSALVFLLGSLRGEELRLMVLTSVSVAVAVVPEGLPAVVTITLARGAQRMLKRKALIRKLPAVETLGSVTVICSDKTGTLTENRMTVTVLDVAGHRLDLTESFRLRSPVWTGKQPGLETARTHPTIGLLLAGAALCNDAILQPRGDDSYQAIGDPTEGALLVAAAKSGLLKPELENALPRQAEIAFDSDRKMMSTFHAARLEAVEGCQDVLSDVCAHLGQTAVVQFTKGSVDGLINRCSAVLENDQIFPISQDWKNRIRAANENLASGGMRVLGVAYRALNSLPAPGNLEESDLVFIGMVGMIDPPRPEVRDAVQVCQTAGIRPIMITGDHPLTAAAIARDLGILPSEGGKVLTGQELEGMSADLLRQAVQDTSVFARVSPEHKLRIVEALQSLGNVAAMTGDGVNDAPALKKADIGVAMGITGTDVTKEAADMILLDDNFATIVSAVEEGRIIYDNLRKFIKFSLTGNLAKVLVVLVGPLLGPSIPLLPLQLLWLNLLTDGLLGLGLGVEPGESGVMRRPPVNPAQGVLTRRTTGTVLWQGLMIGLISLVVGIWYYFTDVAHWQTMLFTTLAFAQVGQAIAARSDSESLFKIGLFTNRSMLLFTFLVIGLQLLVIYVPALAAIFGVLPLTGLDLLIAGGVGAAVFTILEVNKRFQV